MVILVQVPRKRQGHGSAGERKGRERAVYWCGTRKGWSSITRWRKTGVYNSKEQFLALINGWENWEPKDKSKKDAIRTY